MRLGDIAVDVTPLRANRDFRLLFTATALSMLGTALTSVAASIQVYDLGNSSLHVGLVNLVIGVSLCVGLLAGGVLADHTDRRRLILVTRAGSAVVVLALAGNALAPEPQLWFVYLAAIAAGLAGGLGAPALMAVTPALAGREHLAAAGALLTLTTQFGAMVGPGLAGLIAAGPGVAVCYLIDAAGFVLGAVLLSRLPRLPPGSDEDADTDHAAARHPVQAVLDGLRHVRANRVIRALMLVDLAAVVLAMPYALFPEMGNEVFDGGPTAVGLLYTAPAVGAFLGALAGGWIGRVQRPGVTLIVVAALWGAAIAAFGLSRHLWLGLLLLALAGGADTVSEILRRALLQQYTPDRLQGRVGSLWLAQATAGPAAGNALSGGVARLLGPGTTLVAGGVACVAAVVAVAGALPALRAAGPISGPMTDATPTPSTPALAPTPTPTTDSPSTDPGPTADSPTGTPTTNTTTTKG
ncbi:enterobactin transporter EntS [Embleya scabrispora]|uniref:enterobactin transporter EntS n=1 Tax=Embleya scabrispora TaxID=159449 RepID=UPI00036B1E88|nr:enterobactin transporter EntS [Embleya scabrispora]MYS86083.1 enterobactin transporter EntS [Streptomyces sp. SID5474]